MFSTGSSVDSTQLRKESMNLKIDNRKFQTETPRENKMVGGRKPRMNDLRPVRQYKPV